MLGRRMLEPQQALQEGDPGKFPLSFKTLSPCRVESGLVVSIVLSTGRRLRWKGRTHTQLHRGQDPATPLPQFPTALLMRSQLTWGTSVTCLLPQDPVPCSSSQVPAFRPLALLCHHLVSFQSWKAFCLLLHGLVQLLPLQQSLCVYLTPAGSPQHVPA